MKMIKSIAALPVRHIDSATAFYEERFGFICGYRDSGFAKLIRDEVEIHLWASCDNSWKWRSLLLFVKPVWSGAESFLAGTHSCRIEVDNIEELYTELKTSGVLYNRHTEITTTGWGTKEFPTLDLHRNLLTFFQKLA